MDAAFILFILFYPVQLAWPFLMDAAFILFILFILSNSLGLS